MIGLLLVLWFASYVGFWLYDSGCAGHWTRACNDAPINGYRELVSLRWVKEYQSLLAGLLALGGGAFVLLSAVYERAHVRNDALAARNMRVRTALASIRTAFASSAQRLDDVLGFGSTLLPGSISGGPSGGGPSAAVEAAAPQLSETSPNIAEILVRIAQRVDAAFVKIRTADTYEAEREARTYCVGVALYFWNLDRFFDKRTGEVNFPIGDINKLMSEIKGRWGHDLDAAPLLRAFFQ